MCPQCRSSRRIETQSRHRPNHPAGEPRKRGLPTASTLRKARIPSESCGSPRSRCRQNGCERGFPLRWRHHHWPHPTGGTRQTKHRKSRAAPKGFRGAANRPPRRTGAIRGRNPVRAILKKRHRDRRRPWESQKPRRIQSRSASRWPSCHNTRRPPREPTIPSAPKPSPRQRNEEPSPCRPRPGGTQRPRPGIRPFAR